MIQKITNNTQPGIRIMGSLIYGTNGTAYSYSSVDHCYSGFNNTKIMFVRLFYNTPLSGSVDHAYLYLRYSNLASSTLLKLYDTHQISIDSSVLSSLASNYSSSSIPDDSVVAKLQTKSNTSDEEEYVRFDITNIIREKEESGGSFYVVLMIASDLTTIGFSVFDITYETADVCSTTISVIDGISSDFQYEKGSAGFAGTNYINLASGNLILNFSGLTSYDNKMPLSFSMFYNSSRYASAYHLGKGFKASTNYLIYSSGGSMIIEDPTGLKNAFTPIDTSTAENLDIDTSLASGSIYYSFSSGNYLFCGSGNLIKLYDKNGNCTEFYYDGTNTRIQSYTNKLGKSITYNWSDNYNRLQGMANSAGESMAFSYDSSSRMSTIILSSANRVTLRHLSFTYDSNNCLTHVALYKNLNATSLYDATYTYSNSRLIRANDDTDSLGSIFTYTNSKITHINYYKTTVSELRGYKTIAYSTNFTSITDNNGDISYYYFNQCGKCIMIMDKNGKTIAFNYDEIEDGESSNLVGQSNIQCNSRNLIENNSFESDDNDLWQGSSSWITPGEPQYSTIETANGGVYGGKYLKVEKGTLDASLNIYQEIIAPSTGSYTLTGFIKHNKLDSNSIVSGNINVKLSSTYKQSTSVLVSGSESAGNAVYETQEVSHSIYQQKYNFAGDIDWYKFSLSTLIIPSTAYDIKLNISIVLSGSKSYLVGFDDFQLSSGDKNTRYNFVENGYLESINSTTNRPRGFIFENLVSSDVMSFVSSSDEHSPILGNDVMKLTAGNKTLLSGELVAKKMYRTITMSGSAGDELIMSVFGKALTTSNDIFKAFIKFDYTNGTDNTFNFDFTPNFSNWQLLTRDIFAEAAFSQITIGVEYSGNGNAYFDAFQLYKDTYGKHYAYDKKNNLVSIIGDDSSTSVIYTAENDVRSLVLSDGSCFRYEYDDHRQLTDVYDASGNHLEITYDSDGNRTTMNLTTTSGKTMNLSSTFDTKGNVLSSTDELNKTYSYIYDAYNCAIQETDPNTRVLHNTYDDYTQLTQLLSNDGTSDSSNSYVYDDAGNLTSLACSNGTAYSFVYNDLGYVTSIQINGVTHDLKEFTKLRNNVNTGLLTRKTYGTAGDYYLFNYDTKNRLTKVTLNGSTTVVSEYSYDENDLITEVKDARNALTRYYSYSRKGQLEKVTTSDNDVISYEYDNLNGLQKAIYNINNVIRTFDYQYKYELNEDSKEGYFTRIESAFGDEVVKGGMDAKGTYGADPSINTATAGVDTVAGVTTYTFNKKNSRIHYPISTLNTLRNGTYVNGTPFYYSTWSLNFAYNKTFYAWVKPTGSFAQECIVQFADEDDNEAYGSLIITSAGKLAYKPTGASIIVQTSSALTLGAFNLVGIKFDQTSTGQTVKLYLNGTVSAESSIDHLVRVIKYIRVGNQSEFGSINGTLLTMPFSICLMSFGAREYSDSELREIYTIGKKYLIDGDVIEKSSAVIYSNKSIYDSYDVITLNGSLSSKNGINPKEIIKTDTSYKADKARIFKYDSETKKHAYGSYSEYNNLTPGNVSLLKYFLGLGSEGTFSVRFKLDSTASSLNRYLLSFKNLSGTKLCAYYNSNVNDLVLSDNSNNFKLLSLSFDVWHTLSVSYNASGTIICFDGTNYTNSLSLDLTGSTLYLGCDGSGENQLNGLIEMFIFKDIKVSSSALLSIYNAGGPTVVRKAYDVLDRKISDGIITNSVAFNSSYVYGDTSTTISPLVTTQTLPGGNSITYTYDSMRNVLSKTELTSNGLYVSKVEYDYDLYGRLKEEDTYTVTNGNLSASYKFKYYYDQNGNISLVRKYTSSDTLVSSKNYTYDTTIKDKLLTIVDNGVTTALTYDSDFVFNPITIGSSSLTWEGRRLLTYGSDSFTYNEEGIRIQKNVGSVVHNYDLEGKRVIGETIYNPSVHFDYNYDEEGIIIGLTYNNTDYFYIRDITGNIVKIIDELGATVVKYSYNAWGKVTKTNVANTTASGIIYTYNPYLYKGYYYDSEIELYYCNTRYYSPELCRWISADAIGYLDTSALENSNLYVYCGNNPVMGYDPNGKTWKSFWKRVGKWASETFGMAYNEQIKTGYDFYLFFIQGQSGVGIIDNSQSQFIDFVLSYPAISWNDIKTSISAGTLTCNDIENLLSFSIGIKINFPDVSLGINWGLTSSVSISSKNLSYSESINWLGRVGRQIDFIDDDGSYTFIRISENIPEIAAAVIICYIAPELIPAIVEFIMGELTGCYA